MYGTEERLQKILSTGGVCSRRTAEEYIRAGRVTVNGEIAELGRKADPEKDVVALDGKAVGEIGPRTYLMLNKPRGYVTTLSDEKGRKTVRELVEDCPARVWPVGRLDMDSEGLLLLTDDGALTNQLIHPSHEVEKEYLVWVSGNAGEALEELRKPMVLDGIPLRSARVTLRNDRLLDIVIHEGKNRQIRRMCQAAGLAVTRLKRIREGDVVLGELPSGQWRVLTAEELEKLKQS